MRAGLAWGKEAETTTHKAREGGRERLALPMLERCLRRPIDRKKGDNVIAQQLCFRAHGFLCARYKPLPMWLGTDQLQLVATGGFDLYITHALALPIVPASLTHCPC